jgi:hypothetical protein
MGQTALKHFVQGAIDIGVLEIAAGKGSHLRVRKSDT